MPPIGPHPANPTPYEQTRQGEAEEEDVFISPEEDGYEYAPAPPLMDGYRVPYPHDIRGGNGYHYTVPTPELDGYSDKFHDPYPYH